MKSRSLSAPSFEADDTRYQFERKLGEGGAGAVYLVRDRETGEQLALKKLLRVDAKSVLRLKREFRSLQAINHPHIVKLYDMGQSKDSWFLTMEYLEGDDLKGYLKREGDAKRGSSVATLTAAFRQLALGISALHDAGMLHRDLKPSNVIVVKHRVVVLDFGLVRELVSAATVTEDGAMAGTPAYMAPEQIMAKELSAAADWYAFGVMLYEALSGYMPFGGQLLELLRSKLEGDPPPLLEIEPSAPRDLSELCDQLLRRDPSQRPTGAEVLARFAASESPLPAALMTVTATENIFPTELESRYGQSELFGRGEAFAELWKALGQAEQGRAVVVHVRGASGAGKSALVEHFLDQLKHAAVPKMAEVLVLRSRCYELEAMPFKALDGVMDALTRHLSHRSDVDVAHLMPPSVGALAQVFPVIARLNAVRRLVATSGRQYDAVQSLRQAETALRVLLENLAARSPIVLWIDDLQWGDLDSARILRSWITQPSAAPLLFVFSYRSDEVATSTCLRKLLGEEGPQETNTLEHVIELAPLASIDIRAMCERRLLPQTKHRDDLIEHVVRDAQGSPFLASQLIALAVAKIARGEGDLEALSIDLMLAQTRALLSADAYRVLVVLAVAGRPMAAKPVLQAAAVQHGGRGLVRDLRTLNLVRTRDVSGQRMIEVYHDRIREGVQGALSGQERQQVQERLFSVLELSLSAEPDWLHALALGAGKLTEALYYGSAAAERANASLAFERAAGLYKACIELSPPAEVGEYWCKLSLAYARSGRAKDAGHAALAAAKHVTQDQQLVWTQRAASQLLRSGHFAQGEALVRKVLEAKKIRLPESALGFAAAIAWERAQIRLHGTSDTLRDAADCPREALERFDLLTTLFVDTHTYDPLRATLFQLRALRIALELGEPMRLVRALTTASTVAALYGSAHAAAEADALLARAAAINAKLSVPDEQTMSVSRAVNAFGLGRLNEVLAPVQTAGRLLRSDAQEDPSGNYMRRFGVAVMRISVQQFLGRHAQCLEELRSLLEEAAATDNRELALRLTRSHTIAEQLQGAAQKSRARLDAQRADLPMHSFGVLHVVHMVAVMSTACWTNDYAWAHEYLATAWDRFLASPVRYAAYLGLMAHAEHARLLLNERVTAHAGADPARLLSSDLRALRKSPLPWAAGFVHRYCARLAYLAGRVPEAVVALRASAEAFTKSNLLHEASRDQYALGITLGADGLPQRETAVQSLYGMGVVDVLADIRAHFPELVGSE